MTPVTARRTIEEIMADEKAAHAAYEARTVGARVNERDVTIAELRQVFEAVQSKLGWKKPWAASVPYQAVSLVIEATKFFHGDIPTVDGIEPITGNVLMSGKGYQAW